MDAFRGEGGFAPLPHGEIGENFLLVKISVYTVNVYCIIKFGFSIGALIKFHA